GLLVGKVAILEWLGLSLGRHVGTSGISSPLGAFLLGALIITVLYLVPVLGLVTFGIVSVWGLGCAVMAAFGGFRREMPEKPTTPPATDAVPPITPISAMAPATGGSNPAPASVASNAVPPLQPETAASAMGNPVPEVAT